MKVIENLMLQVRVLYDGAIQVRRADGKPLTEQDRKEARHLADSSPGITLNDVLRTFPVAKFIHSEWK